MFLNVIVFLCPLRFITLISTANLVIAIVCDACHRCPLVAQCQPFVPLQAVFFPACIESYTYIKNCWKQKEQYFCIESTGKCKLAAKLGIMFEKDLIWCEEI